MKTFLLLTLFIMSTLVCAHAGSDPFILITTTNSGVTYKLHDYELPNPGDYRTPDEIEAWFRKRPPERLNAVIYIVPDDRTTLKTVFTILRCLKNAGVKSFAVTSHDGEHSHFIFGTTDKIILGGVEPARARK